MYKSITHELLQDNNEIIYENIKTIILFARLNIKIN